MNKAIYFFIVIFFIISLPVVIIYKTCTQVYTEKEINNVITNSNFIPPSIIDTLIKYEKYDTLINFDGYGDLNDQIKIIHCNNYIFAFHQDFDGFPIIFYNKINKIWHPTDTLDISLIDSTSLIDENKDGLKDILLYQYNYKNKSDVKFFIFDKEDKIFKACKRYDDYLNY